ncbi:MAG: hypothetical protein CFE31_07795 [Rhizobiales bacterium PAR1]|nr:MAG: hypothetical protein CFE31_07795 [Rhizobiales bacterium PAR1]
MGWAVRPVLKSRLLGKFLLWLVPSFVLVSAGGMVLITEHELRQEMDLISARVGNHAGRAAAAINRHDAVQEPDLAADLLSSLTADRAVRCAALWADPLPAKIITVPRGLTCAPGRDDPQLDIPVDDLVGSRLIVALDLSEITEARRRQRDQSFLLLVFGLLVAVGASMMAFRQTIGTPLRRLLAAISHTASTGEFRSITGKTSDEFGVVIDNYNTMQTRLKTNNAEVAASLKEIRQLYNTTPAPMLCVDKGGLITEASDFWLEFIGRERGEVLGHPVQAFLRAMKTPKRGVHCHGACLVHKTAHSEHKRAEVIVKHASGREIDGLLSVSHREQEGGGFLCVVTDISHLREAERALKRVALTDRLTGLPNRAAINDLVESIRHDLDPTGYLAILYIDLDNFKQVNDSFGHESGDQLLKEVVRRMQACLKPDASVIRLGGDEFAIMLADTEGLPEAQRVAGAVIEAVRSPVELGEDAVGHVSASVGIAALGESDEEWSEGLRAADLAMYEAKQGGKNRFALYSDALGQAVDARTARANTIRDGLDSGWFSLLFQPIVRLSDLCPIGAESLLRLQRPGMAAEPTQAIIQTAEETGQITQIGEWVLRDALTHAGDIAGISAANGYLSLNLSARQLDSRLLPALKAELAATGFPAQRLVVEITETAVIGNFEEAIKILADIRSLGIRVALDDFGTGYSSLSYFNRLPVDIIKLDRSITAGIGAKGRSDEEMRKASALVRSIANFAADLGISVVAEGIESFDVVEELRQLGVPYGQGYLFARPLPASAFRAWVAEFDPATRGGGVSHKRAVNA